MLVVYVYVPLARVIRHAPPPSIFPHPFCKHYVLNGNHGNKRDLYDKICCMCVKT